MTYSENMIIYKCKKTMSYGRNSNYVIGNRKQTGTALLFLFHLDIAFPAGRLAIHLREIVYF